MVKIIIATISDIQYQQPLIRMATSLANNGFDILMVGRKLPNSQPLPKYNFNCKRFNVWFSKGKLQYLEFNLRLFIYLLFKRATIVTAVDLDTALAVYAATAIKGTKRVYDAREYFTELYEVVRRPKVQRIWLTLERYLMPKFKVGTCVGNFIAQAYNQKYGNNFTVIRNVPLLVNIEPNTYANPIGENFKYLLFQGYVNEARGFDSLIPALKHLNLPLVICGQGNYLKQVQQLVATHNLEQKVIFLGQLEPEKLLPYTLHATLGIHLVEPIGLNQKYSLGNKFFDYIHATLPQVCINLPEYELINQKYQIAQLVNTISEQNIADAVNMLLSDDNLYNTLKNNCLIAKQALNWQIEAKILVEFYKNL
jgi:glycosyltransferase involved in cell wall biosynthesis